MRTIVSKWLDRDFARHTRLVDATTMVRQPRQGVVVRDPAAEDRGQRRFDPVEVRFEPVYAWHIPDATISDEFAVHDERHLYVDSSIHCATLPTSEWDGAVADLHRRIARSTPTPDIVDATVLVLHNEGGGTWGHYLAQNFPKVLLFLKQFPHGRIAVPRPHATGSSSFARLFDLFGIPRSTLLPLDAGRSQRVREAVLVDFAWSFQHATIHPVALDLYAAAEAPPRDVPQARGIFITRPGKSARGIANIDAVVAALERRRIVPQTLGSADILDQIAAWRAGLPMIAIQGSDLANMVFARPGTQVLSLSPIWFADSFFFNLAAARELVWSEQFCGEMGEYVEPIRFSSLVVDIATLHRVLDSMGL